MSPDIKARIWQLFEFKNVFGNLSFLSMMKNKFIIKNIVGLGFLASTSLLLAQDKGDKTLGHYSSIKEKDCIIVNGSALQAEPEIDFVEMQCPSMGGYEVEISGGDIRYNLKLSYRGQSIQLPSPMGFHDLGSEVIEWRFSREKTPNGFGSDTLKYWALIYRINARLPQSDGDLKDISTLYVVRLKGNESCAVAAISTESHPGQDLNKLAVLAAEDESLKCLSNE